MKRWIHASTEYSDNSDLGYIDERIRLAHRSDDPEILSRLANDSDEEVREHLAWSVSQDDSVPVEILQKLVHDESRKVRCNVSSLCNNLNILKQLMNDQDQTVRYRAKDHVIDCIRNKNLLDIISLMIF